MRIQTYNAQNQRRDLIKPDIKTVVTGSIVVSIVSSIGIMILSKGHEPADSIGFKSYAAAVLWATLSFQGPCWIRTSVNTVNELFTRVLTCRFY